jgi:hypothetical protein
MLRPDEITLKVGSRLDTFDNRRRWPMNHHQRLDRVSVALRGAEPPIVAEFRGEPNRALSTRREMRWGTKGSFSLQLDGPKAGLWFDHELGRGGDIIELMRDLTDEDAPQIAENASPASSPSSPSGRGVEIPTPANDADKPVASDDKEAAP